MKSKNPSNSVKNVEGELSPKKRFRFGIGPNLIFVLLLIGFALYRYRDQLSMIQLFGSGTKPSLDKKTQSESNLPQSPKYLLQNPDSILDYREKIHLTAEQVDKIKPILTNWEKETKELNEKLTEETQKVQGYLSKSSSKPSTSAIQSQSLDYSELSQQLADKRHEYWNQILNILTLEQKAILENGGKLQ